MHETLREPVIGRYSTNEQMVLSEHCSQNADSGTLLVHIVGFLLRISLWVWILSTFTIFISQEKYAKNKDYLSGFPENLLLTS